MFNTHSFHSRVQVSYFLICPLVLLLLCIRYRGIFNLPTSFQEINYYSESSFYYSFYNNICKHTRFDLYDMSEWPNVHISFRRYNILFEIILGYLYKLLSHIYPFSHFNFYSGIVLLIHSLGITSLCLFSSLIGNYTCGLVFLALYMSLFQKKLISRISALPLRENISLPFFWMSLVPLIELIENSNADKNESVGYKIKRFNLWYKICIAISLLTWQFSPFLISTQLLVIIFLSFVKIVTSNVCDRVIKLCVISYAIAAVLSLFSPLLIGSLLTKVLVAYYTSQMLFPHINQLIGRFNISFDYELIGEFVAKSFTFGIILIIVNVAFNLYFVDDSHVFDMFFVKIGLKKPNFDTLIYEMGAEFRFFPKFMLDLVLTTNLPILLLLSLLSRAFLLYNRADPSQFYLVLQAFGLTILMLLVARLRILALPMLCVLASLSASSKYWIELPPVRRIPQAYIPYIRFIIPILIFSTASAPLTRVGILEEIGSHNKYGEVYYTEQAAELVEWVKYVSTEYRMNGESVVFSDMPTSSIIRSATNAKLVVNPHYENKPVKERIRLYYSLASCINDSAWLYQRLGMYDTNYLIVQVKMLSVFGDGIESLVNSLEYPNSFCRPREDINNRLIYKLMTYDHHFKLVFVNGGYLVFALDKVEGLHKIEFILAKGDILSIYLPTEDVKIMNEFYRIGLEEFSDVLHNIGFVQAGEQVYNFVQDYFKQ